MILPYVLFVVCLFVVSVMTSVGFKGRPLVLIVIAYFLRNMLRNIQT